MGTMHRSFLFFGLLRRFKHINKNPVTFPACSFCRKNHYETLGVESDATAEEIRNAWFQKRKLLHPIDSLRAKKLPELLPNFKSDDNALDKSDSILIPDSNPTGQKLTKTVSELHPDANIVTQNISELNPDSNPTDDALTKTVSELHPDANIVTQNISEDYQSPSHEKESNPWWHPSSWKKSKELLHPDSNPTGQRLTKTVSEVHANMPICQDANIIRQNISEVVPDSNPDEDALTKTLEFSKVIEAYSILGLESRRNNYDLQLLDDEEREINFWIQFKNDVKVWLAVSLIWFVSLAPMYFSYKNTLQMVEERLKAVSQQQSEEEEIWEGDIIDPETGTLQEYFPARTFVSVAQKDV